MSFEDYLIKIGRKKATIKKHLIRLNVINRKIKKWNTKSVDNFIIDLKKSGIKNVTINSYIDTIRLFSQTNNYPNELCNYKHYKPDLSIKGTFSDEEIESIINLPCPAGNDKEVWNKYSLIYSLLAYSGMRPQEVCMLRKENIDWGKNVFSIEVSKTGPRFVPIPPNLKDTLKEYVDSLPTQELFLSSRNETISVKSYYHDFRKRKDILKIDRPHISVYSFRHSYATKMLETGSINLHILAKLLGHSIEQTAHYEHLTTKDLQQAILKHPTIRKYTEPEHIISNIKEYIESYELDKLVNIKYTLVYINGELTIKIRPI